MNWEDTTMALKNGFFTLALSALFFTPVAAMAADTTHHAASPVVNNWAPGRDSHRAPPPRPSPRSRDGRYELQTVQTNVPGRYERVWVAERCVTTRRHVRSCEAGHYEQRWVPGYTESSQQWVWIPYARGPHYGRG
jgi:hypothetical protein